ncbi:ATP-binding protein [Candidatus Bathyarchaeota archaeon]|nr:ATP-binding protein [Candidatus Bathyarchaeota archaeon]
MSEKKVGVIVGEATTDMFYFASSIDDYPPKWEYLMVLSNEIADGEIREVQVLAQVERIVSASQVLSREVDFDAINRILQARIEDLRTWGKARVLGYIHHEPSGGRRRVLLPRRAVVPGRPVYIAPVPLLREFYSSTAEDGLHIGELINRPDVPVFISASGLRRHLAIIAQTGAGKSYCAGVLIEELLEKGATILILDPHSDYVLLSQSRGGGLHNLSSRVVVFRNKAATGRYKDVGNVRPYEIAFTELTPDEVCDIAGIREKAVNQRNAVAEALKSFKEEIYTPADLVKKLEDPSGWTEDNKIRNAAKSALKYIRSLSKLNVFGLTSTEISEILKPMNVSVIDLSGLEDKTMNYIASNILYETYEAVSKGEYGFPVFIVIEEAHKFVPFEGTSYSSSITNRIAAEGRKFGIFLILITQRPSKIASDSLSQCNSQIIMRLTNPDDQNAVAKSSERMSADLLGNLPGLNPGEAIVVGEVTTVPVMIKVRERLTREGGSDIDLAKKLEEARLEVNAAGRADEDEARRQRFTGQFGAE